MGWMSITLYDELTKRNISGEISKRIELSDVENPMI